MIYQLTSGKEIIARVENNFTVDYSDWVTRAPLWIADALDQMKMITTYEDRSIDLIIEDHIVILPDFFPQDIRRILLCTYNGLPMRRLNTVNPIKQPIISVYNESAETYSIKNGYIVSSLEEGTITIYFQTPAIEYDQYLQVYIPKVPIDSVIQGAIEWYIIYSILKRGHKHPIFSLDSTNVVTNPFLMWEHEKKKAMNRTENFDPEDRAEMSRILRAFAVDVNRPLTHSFRQEEIQNLSDSITGQTGI